MIEIWCRASPIFWSVSLRKIGFWKLCLESNKTFKWRYKGKLQKRFYFSNWTYICKWFGYSLAMLDCQRLASSLYTEKRKNRLRICVLRWLIKKIPKCRPCSLHFSYHVWWFWCRMMTISFSRWIHGVFSTDAIFVVYLDRGQFFNMKAQDQPLRLKGI